jgi:hypothetical protein
MEGNSWRTNCTRTLFTIISIRKLNFGGFSFVIKKENKIKLFCIWLRLIYTEKKKRWEYPTRTFFFSLGWKINIHRYCFHLDRWHDKKINTRTDCSDRWVGCLTWMYLSFKLSFYLNWISSPVIEVDGDFLRWNKDLFSW